MRLFTATFAIAFFSCLASTFAAVATHNCSEYNEIRQPPHTWWSTPKEIDSYLYVYMEGNLSGYAVNVDYLDPKESVLFVELMGKGASKELQIEATPKSGFQHQFKMNFVGNNKKILQSFTFKADGTRCRKIFTFDRDQLGSVSVQRKL